VTQASAVVSDLNGEGVSKKTLLNKEFLPGGQLACPSFAMDKLAARLARSFAFRSKPPSTTVLRASVSFSTATAATAAAVASMAAYSSVVSKLETAADVPEEARLATHHVKGRHGNTVKFRNPHPSAGGIPDAIPVAAAKALW
jgi:hypothetical protein